MIQWQLLWGDAVAELKVEASVVCVCLFGGGGGGGGGGLCTGLLQSLISYLKLKLVKGLLGRSGQKNVICTPVRKEKAALLEQKWLHSQHSKYQYGSEVNGQAVHRIYSRESHVSFPKVFTRDTWEPDTLPPSLLCYVQSFQDFSLIEFQLHHLTHGVCILALTLSLFMKKEYSMETL